MCKIDALLENYTFFGEEGRQAIINDILSSQKFQGRFGDVFTKYRKQSSDDKFWNKQLDCQWSQPSPWAFLARSILDSTVSCNVTERYTPRTPSQYFQIKYGGPFVRLLQLHPKVAENPSFEQQEFLCACHSEKQSFSFLKKDPRDQVLFNLSGLSRAATGTRRWTSFLNLCQWISARWRSWGYGLSSKQETRQTCILSTYAS